LKKISLFGFLMIIASIWGLPKFENIDDKEYSKIVNKHFGFDSIEMVTNDFGRFGKTKDNQFTLLTPDFAQPIGYRGPTSVLLLVDKDGRIVNSTYMGSFETPAYIAHCLKMGLVSSLDQKYLLEQKRVEVYIITGATKTCLAVEESVNMTLRAFHKWQESLKR